MTSLTMFLNMHVHEHTWLLMRSSAEQCEVCPPLLEGCCGFEPNFLQISEKIIDPRRSRNDDPEPDILTNARQGSSADGHGS